MAKHYSNDLRERVASYAIAHKSANLAAQTFSVSKATAVRWAKQLRDTGTVKSGKVGGHKPHLLRDERDWLMARIACEPHVSLRHLLVELGANGVAVSYGTLWNFMHDQDLSFKKKQFTRPNSKDLMLPDAGIGGRNTKAELNHHGSCSLTKHGPRPTWRHCGVGHRKGRGLSVAYLTVIGKP